MFAATQCFVYTVFIRACNTCLNHILRAYIRCWLLILAFIFFLAFTTAIFLVWMVRDKLISAILAQLRRTFDILPTCQPAAMAVLRTGSFWQFCPALDTEFSFVHVSCLYYILFYIILLFEEVQT